jgi:hypothetical protein
VYTLFCREKEGKEFPQNGGIPMKNNNKILSETKERIDKFAIKVATRISRPRKKFLRQMIYGMQAAMDVKISDISRGLCEKIKLIKTENRLTRHLATEDLTDILNGNLLKESGKRIRKDTVLAIDLSDIRKDFAKKMENMDGIWDGSKKEKAKGYWICEIVGAEVDGNDVTPLYSEAYSQSADDFESENIQILNAVEKVYAATKGNGILTMDRGGARPEIVVNIDKKRHDFVIRMRGDRHIMDCRGNKQSLAELARKTRCPVEHEMEVNKDGSTHNYTACLGARKNVLYAGVKLNIVVVRGFGDDEMILATNTNKTEKEVLEIYLTRWKCEESFRFLKNEYNLEDVRVRSYVAIRNVVAILHAVFYFLSVELGIKLAFSIVFKKVMERAKRFFEVTIFRQYALADGLGRMLYETGWQDMHPENRKRSRQMALNFGS